MKRAGIHEIAKLARVSIGTVDRALHGRPGISPATRAKVLGIARKLQYSPHPAARALSVGRTILIGVCIPEEIRFFYDQMRAGIFDEARRSIGLGVEIVYRPIPQLGEGEADRISELLRAKVNGLIVAPGNPEVVSPIINRAEKQHVRVVCISTDAPSSRRSTVVCVNPLLNGRLAAESVSKFVPPGAKVAVVTGMLATVDHQQKTDGFCAGFKEYCPDGEVVAVVEGHESAEESYKKVQALIRDHPDLRGLYVNTVNSLPVCRVLEEQGVASRVCLVTTDLFREMVPHFERATIRASIYQDPYLQGQMAVRVLADHLLHRTQIPAAQYLNPGIVLRTNLPLFREIQAAKS